MTICPNCGSTDTPTERRPDGCVGPQAPGRPVPAVDDDDDVVRAEVEAWTRRFRPTPGADDNPKPRRPGSSWRILAYEHIEGQEGNGPEIHVSSHTPAVPNTIDEVVIDRAVHLEQVDATHWHLRIATGGSNLSIDFGIGPDGYASDVRVAADDFDPKTRIRFA